MLCTTASKAEKAKHLSFRRPAPQVRAAWRGLMQRSLGSSVTIGLLPNGGLLSF